MCTTDNDVDEVTKPVPRKETFDERADRHQLEMIEELNRKGRLDPPVIVPAITENLHSATHLR